MLINCPRCGFQQPQDKYCAQCGVDMESFKPLAPPLWKRIFGNHLVQLSLLLLIATGIGISLYQRGARDLAARSQYLQKSLQINADTGYSTASSSEALMQEQMQELPPDPEAAASSAMAGEATNLQKRGIAQASDQPQLIVTYAEVSREMLQTLSEISRLSGQYMDFESYSAGIVPALHKRIEAAGPNVTPLHTETRPLNEQDKMLEWFLGVEDPRDPRIRVGLTTSFAISVLRESSLRGNIRITRNWRLRTPNGGFGFQRHFFPAIIEIDASSGFFIAGILPRQTNLNGDDSIEELDTFRILNSERFQKGESEFVIFVEMSK